MAVFLFPYDCGWLVLPKEKKIISLGMEGKQTQTEHKNQIKNKQIDNNGSEGKHNLKFMLYEMVCMSLTCLPVCWLEKINKCILVLS